MLTDVKTMTRKDVIHVKKATFLKRNKERREGHMKDALALGGEEGRDKLR